jgi:hypothetical protein
MKFFYEGGGKKSPDKFGTPKQINLMTLNIDITAGSNVLTFKNT